MKTCWMFPGQGSQKAGMGKEEFDAFPELVRKADSILGFSIRELCLEDPQQFLGKTDYTQPALYVVNALTYLKRLRETGTSPDVVIGHSLGEYCALFAAGAFSFETGLELVRERGRIMAEVDGGGMTAVIGLKADSIRRALDESGLSGVDIANVNAPVQIVLAGKKEDIAQAQKVCKAAGARICIPLQVSGAFHSRYMQEAADRFKAVLEKVAFAPLKIPVISNVTALPSTHHEIGRLLVDQMTHSVKWTESIGFLIDQGVEEFIEIGPGEVLAGLVGKIRQAISPPASDRSRAGQSPAMPVVPAPRLRLTAKDLGTQAFTTEFGLTYAYAAGGMYRGVASKDMVVRLAKAGMLGFLGTGGLSLDRIQSEITAIKGELKNGESYGANLLYNLTNPDLEERTIDLFMTSGVTKIEAAAFMQMTPALVKYRLRGLYRDSQGRVSASNKIMAKLSRPEVATLFLSPAPERLVKTLLEQGKVTAEQAILAKSVPMADAITVEADSGGHTDQGVAYVLTPAMIRLRDELQHRYGYTTRVHVGAAGGIGTPEAAAAAFIMGADYIVTGSINQCSTEAGTSEVVKGILQTLEVQDTAYAPAGDMFEIGAKVQVVKKGVFFPARANKLYELYRHHLSIDEIDAKTRAQVEENYFHKSFEAVWQDCEAHFAVSAPHELDKARKNPKAKMALIFRWYFGYSSDLALSGSSAHKVDYQIHSGPALGAFNQWVKGTQLESWRNRHVDEIGRKLLDETAGLLEERMSRYMNPENRTQEKKNP